MLDIVSISSPSYSNKQNLGKIFNWHPWIGCKKVSDACKYCRVPSNKPFYFNGFHLSRLKELPSGTVVLVTMLSDFFIEEADSYREQAWEIIKQYSNLVFVIITKRVHRIQKCLPEDWAQGYDNVVLSVTVETNSTINERLPIFKDIIAKHKWLSTAPVLEELNLEYYLEQGWIENVEALGEKCFNSEISFDEIRPCNYSWIESISTQCRKYNVRFSLMAAGHNFIWNNKIYRDFSACYHSKFADELNLDVAKPITFKLDYGYRVI